MTTNIPTQHNVSSIYSHKAHNYSRLPSQDNTHHILTRTKTQSQTNPSFQSIALTAQHDTKEPRTIKEALSKPHWQTAMAEEMHTLKSNETWKLVPRQPYMNVVGLKWVFKTKLKADGTVERFKARLAVKGYNQIEGVNFEDTFSPVVKATNIRIVLSIATTLHWPLKQFDIKNDFLHRDLKETVFMEQPSGFKDPIFIDHVCLLKKAMYGLKQAPKAWFHKFSSYLLHLGFMCSKSDSSLFVWHSDRGTILLLLYVDEIILTGSQSALLNEL